jgi:hypothetical protein
MWNYFFNFGPIWGWVVNAKPRPLYLQENDQVPIVQGDGWDPGPVWTGAESLTATGNPPPYHLAFSESLYLLSYPPPPHTHIYIYIGGPRKSSPGP